MHRDLKPGNIFLDSDYNVKLGDFGLSRVMSDESIFAYTNVGTPYYMSPEQINESKYNEKSDIWSLGCIIYELAALRAPFEATNHMQLANKIREGKVDRIPKLYSDELMSFIRLTMEQNYHKRPNCDTLLEQCDYIKIRVDSKRVDERFARVKRK